MMNQVRSITQGAFGQPGRECADIVRDQRTSSEVFIQTNMLGIECCNVFIKGLGR